MDVQDRWNAPAAALAGRVRRAPDRAFDVQAVTRRHGDSLGDGRAARGDRLTEADRQRIGHLAGTRSRRGDALNWQQPQVLRARFAFADRRDPGTIRQPADGPPDPIPWIDPGAG